MHKPVLLNEVLQIFYPQPGQKYIDATINGGGHARAIAEKIGEKGIILGIDWDCDLIGKLALRLRSGQGIRNKELGVKNIKLVCGNYRDIKKIAQENGFEKVNGILFDLGFSSYHIEKSGRGFSFQRDEPLDMRYHVNDDNDNDYYNGYDKRYTASEIINNASEDELADIFWEYGEERFARKIAEAITRERTKRSIRTTLELVKIIEKAIPRRHRHGHSHRRNRLHPATRIFQALRIAVNDELENLSLALGESAELLGAGGKIAIISFHSLEDRIVKNFLRDKSREGMFKIITSKPITASSEEKILNPRARSAKLRAAIKL